MRQPGGSERARFRKAELWGAQAGGGSAPAGVKGRLPLVVYFN